MLSLAEHAKNAKESWEGRQTAQPRTTKVAERGGGDGQRDELRANRHGGHGLQEAGNPQHRSLAEAQSTQRKASTGFEPSSFDSLRDLGELCEGRLCPLEGRAGLSPRRRERKEERQPLAKAWTEEGRSWSAFAHVAIACPWCSWRALREVALTFPVSVPVLPILTVA
jgi:hypothetical protein